MWTAKVTGPALAGVAATEKFVVVADKDLDLTEDIFRCFDADTGEQKWILKYAAANKLEYTNAPRANPVIHAGRVFLLGALGDLHCVDLVTERSFGRNISPRILTASDRIGVLALRRLSWKTN